MEPSSLPESAAVETAVRIPLRRDCLNGLLAVPAGATGLVIFVHGSGSSRLSPRNAFVARELQRAGMATLLFDLLTAPEEAADQRMGEHRLDIELLSKRVQLATNWARERRDTRELPLGYFGSNTGGAAALITAARLRERVHAVVTRGGRTDLAWEALPDIVAPTMLIVGGLDAEIVESNRRAGARLQCRRSLEIVPAASHLFEEPGALQRAAALAREWFSKNLQPVPVSHP
jgi:dienelactone hydrolase